MKQLNSLYNSNAQELLGRITLSGKNIFNQKSLFDCIKNYYLINNDELKTYLDNIKNLDKAVLTKAGSTEPIIKEINKWL